MPAEPQGRPDTRLIERWLPIAEPGIESIRTPTRTLSGADGGNLTRMRPVVTLAGPRARVRGMEIRYEALGVRNDLTAAHARYWRRLASPGANWSGAQRIAIARETRHASGCAYCRRLRAAFSPHALTGAHDAAPRNSGLLPAPAVDAIHRIVNDASRLTRSWYERPWPADWPTPSTSSWWERWSRW